MKATAIFRKKRKLLSFSLKLFFLCITYTRRIFCIGTSRRKTFFWPKIGILPKWVLKIDFQSLLKRSQIREMTAKQKKSWLITKSSLQIGDFGISKILTSKSKASTVVGTPSYISPELCEGRPYDQKSDVWSLGCILYEMCALQRAFQAPSLPALVLKIMRGRIQPLPSHFSSLLKGSEFLICISINAVFSSFNFKLCMKNANSKKP